MADSDTLLLILNGQEQLRTDVGAQLSAMNLRLDKLVSTDTHAADMKRVDEMHRQNQEDIRDLTTAQARQSEQMFAMQAQMSAAIQAEADARRSALENESKARAAASEKAVSDRRTERWRILGAVTALLAIASTIITTIIR